MRFVMPARRIIPCLDVKDGRVVKGVKFRNHRDAGDIVEQATRYRDEGADELVFYDIGASAEDRSIGLDWAARVAEVIDIPFAVAGGIRTRAQAARCLEHGADKISINSPALERPELIEELAAAFGSQCIVVGIDSFGSGGRHFVHQYTGSEAKSRDTGLQTLDWVKEAANRGAGEIVLNCMGRDGVGTGYDVEHIAVVVDSVAIPVIASGGAGAKEHFRDVLLDAGASGALAASVFHDRIISIPDLKEYLLRCGIEMRR
jgi:cyclase